MTNKHVSFFIMWAIWITAVLCIVICHPCHNQLHAGEIIKHPGGKPAARWFKDDLNRTVLIPVNPCRIVVLATADVEILFAVKAGKTLIGMPDGVRYPPEASDIGRIGGTTTHGGKSRESNMVRMAGGINIFSNVEKNSFMACNEEVISRDPEVIILTANLKERNPDELKRIIKSRPGWAETRAVKNNRIYIVEEQITWANPRIVLGIETLLQCMHPELFTAPEGGHHIQK